MAYTIYNTDGSVLLTLGEGKIDQKYTSLTLIGKNVNSYGEYFNNNLISILGNFASTDEPRSPVVGQLWYDTASGRMKVYDLNSVFRPITNTIAGDEQPTELANNDFWWDTLNEQIKFTPNGTDIYVVGPTDSTLLGRNGWVAETIVDDGGNDQIVTSLYSAGHLVGILSTSSFTNSASTSGITTVSVGLNLNQTFSGIKFIGTATSADSVAGLDVTTFVRNDINQTMNGGLTIQNDLGLHVLNSALDGFTIASNPTNHQGIISYDSTDKVFKLQVTNGTLGSTPVLYVDSATLRAGIWNQTPQYPLDIIGDTRIQGNLIVSGTLTNITSVDLKIVDKNIELATGQGTPLDSYADAGGFTLHGTTDHKLYWKNNGTGWNFNDNTNLYFDAETFTGLTASGNTGTSATFTVVNTDGVYGVTLVNSGTNYSTLTSIISWSTTTPATITWSTSTPYFSGWYTGTDHTYLGVTGTSSLSGNGFATDITVINTQSAYFLSGSGTVAGSGYVPGEVITFPGTSLGGISPDNDLQFYIISTGTAGAVTDGDITGTNTAVWFTTTPFNSWSTSSIGSTLVWSTTTPSVVINNASYLTITGDYLGGATPDNDLTIHITTTTVGGSISGFTYSGLGKTWEYKISSSTVITKTSLGTGIVKAPGLQTVGVMSYLTVTNLYLEGNTIQTLGTNQTLYLNASGLGTVDVTNNKITSLQTPTSDYDAATKKYVDDTLFKTVQSTFGVVLDTTGVVNVHDFVYDKLMFLYPPVNSGLDAVFDLPDGSRAKVLCGVTTVTTSSTATVNVNFATDTADQGGVYNAVSVVAGALGSISAQLPPQLYYPTTTYTTQTWVVSTGSWIIVP